MFRNEVNIAGEKGGYDAGSEGQEPCGKCKEYVSSNQHIPAIMGVTLVSNQHLSALHGG
jgi:hypothetical protein